jgi:lipoprotein-anchoring transpeptidase ErfK/SrfK
MMARTQNKANQGWVLAAVLVLSGFALGQTNESGIDARRERIRRQVVVSIPDRKLAVLENGTVIRIFPVAVGAAVSPSPVGQFEIVSRVANPTYYHAGVVVPPGSGNPVGPRWIGLNQKGYGIHGTNQPRSIGHAESHGCIRLRNHQIEELYEMVRVGDTVEIRAERDDQTAQIFGEATETVASASNGTVASGQ